VEVFGRTVAPGCLIHADKHGFLVVPPEEEGWLLEAARFMDANECRTVIPAARNTTGKSMDEILRQMEDAAREFGRAAREKFHTRGEF
jgi:regulator of RNase E activity RraA